MNEIYEDIELKVIAILFGAWNQFTLQISKNKGYDQNNDDQ